MIKKENLKFKKIINENGVPITNCYYIDMPENILATMVEDAPKDFKEPLYLQKSVSVSVPNNEAGERIEISIWISPNDLSSKKTSMTFDNDGKLVLNFNK